MLLYGNKITLIIIKLFIKAPENYPENKYAGVQQDDDDSIEEDPDPEELNIKISNKIDIWAYGIIVNETFSGEKPWQRKLSKNVSSQIKALQIQQLLIRREMFEPNDKMKNEIQNIVIACTRLNPAQRPSMRQLKIHLLKKFYLLVKNTDLSKILIKETYKDRRMLMNKVRKYVSQFRDIAYLYERG